MSIPEKGTPVRVCLALIFALGFFVFFAPVLSGIINFGNSAGMAIFTFLFILVIFWNKISVLFRTDMIFRGISLFLCGIALIFTVLSLIVSAKMLLAAENPPPDGKTVLIVLGCKVRGETPSLMLNRRIMTACEFMKEHPDSVCVASGGQGADEDISEAECIKRVLVENGISSDRIILEDRSTSTDENIRFSKEKIEENDLTGNITVVTNAYHQLRASMIAVNYGIESYAVSADTSLWLIPTYWLREIFGVMYQFVFG